MTSMFFPSTRTGESFDERPAKAVCATCPVMTQCFKHLVSVTDFWGQREFGVWGHVGEGEVVKFRAASDLIDSMSEEELRAYVIRLTPPRPPRKSSTKKGTPHDQPALV